MLCRKELDGQKIDAWEWNFMFMSNLSLCSIKNEKLKTKNFMETLLHLPSIYSPIQLPLKNIISIKNAAVIIKALILTSIVTGTTTSNLTLPSSAENRLPCLKVEVNLSPTFWTFFCIMVLFLIIRSLMSCSMSAPIWFKKKLKR